MYKNVHSVFLFNIQFVVESSKPTDQFIHIHTDILYQLFNELTSFMLFNSFHVQQITNT